MYIMTYCKTNVFCVVLFVECGVHAHQVDFHCLQMTECDIGQQHINYVKFLLKRYACTFDNTTALYMYVYVI